MFVCGWYKFLCRKTTKVSIYLYCVKISIQSSSNKFALPTYHIIICRELIINLVDVLCYT